jgi:proton-translocating NADH-quinone oxidoreductase chain M
MLLSLFGLTILSIVHISLLSDTDKIKKFGLIYSGIIFLNSLCCGVNFDSLSTQYQFVFGFPWIGFFNYNFYFGIDGISLFFIILSTFLIHICLLNSWNSVTHSIKSYTLCFCVLNFLLISVFSAIDILLFYVFFETILIPMFLIIGVWGSRQRKIRAVYLFFFYTLIGGIIMLLGIITLITKTGTSNYEVCSNYSFSTIEQRWLWLAFFASLASKIPMFPFHVWLPEAHVEAPTSGSVLLAGILLKLGSYGFIRFSVLLFPEASYYFSPLIYTLGGIAIVFTSLSALRQTDFKRIIAYSSVAHMNLVMLGIFSFNANGLEGALLQSLSHGFVSSALFLGLGIFYDRYGTRNVNYFSGSVIMMPITTTLFLFFTMANIALPGTSSFVGEFLILAGIFKINTVAAIIGATGMILGGAYSLWLFNRIAYGNLKTEYISTYKDINSREFIIMMPLVLGTLVMGIYPDVFLEPMHASIFISQF